MLSPSPLMNWQCFLEFLNERRPGIGDQIRGTPVSEIESLQRRCPQPLPKNYVNFLRYFGSSAGEFPFFLEHRYLIQDLLEFPTEAVAWDPLRYLLIGILESRDREDPFDLFLDLAKGNAVDAPLVGIDPDPEESNPPVIRLAHGLADRAISQAAWRCALNDQPAKARLVALCQSVPDSSAMLHRHRELVAIAERLGFAACVSATPYTWLGRRERETFALIYAGVDDSLVICELRGNDQAAIAQAREVIADSSLAKPTQLIGD